jgi:hypothetical protein
MMYTAAGQKAKPKVRMSTGVIHSETTDTGNSSKTAVEHGGAQIE